jgi:glycosyltransferase involved in cell wall biosynthesis
MPWGDVLEDWLGVVGITLEGFRTEMGGSWIFSYAEALRSAGIEPGLICISRDVSRPLRTTHDPSGTRLHVLPASPLFRLLRRGSSTRTGGRPTGRAAGRLRWSAERLFATPILPLTRVLRTEGYDALLCQEYESLRFDLCVASGRVVQVPVFGVFQGQSSALSSFERVWRGASIRASAGLIVGPQIEAQRVIRTYGLGESRIGRIPNAVDTTFWRPLDRPEARSRLGLSADAEVAVWHGPVVFATKALDTLVQAWSLVSRARPDRRLELMIVGTGVDSARLRELATAEGLANVRHIDEYVLDRERLRTYLSAADLYVFPSRREGFPVAPLEAMACGLPVVAATASGIPDIFPGHERSGAIIVPLDDPNALAVGILRLLDNHALRTALGQRARTRVTNAFSLGEVGRRLREFLETRA